MKKVIAILVIALGFTLNTNAQDKMMKKETVKTVSLEQTKGAFTQKQITLSAGIYIFEISNKSDKCHYTYCGLFLNNSTQTVLRL